MLKPYFRLLGLLALLLSVAQPSYSYEYPLLSSEEFFCEAGTHPTRYENFGKSCKYDSWAWLPGERHPRPISEEEMCRRLHDFQPGAGLCVRSRRAACKGSETYPGTVLCSSMGVCPDRDSDGFPCCGTSDVVVSSGHHNMTPDKQDCPLPGSPAHQHCVDNDKDIHPDSPVRIKDFVNLTVAWQDASAAANSILSSDFNQLEDLPPAEQLGITPLTPLDVRIYTKYCHKPAPFFIPQVELLAGPNDEVVHTWHSHSLTGQPVPQFDLMSIYAASGIAQYQAVLPPISLFHLSIPGQQKLIAAIAAGQVPKLRFTIDNQEPYIKAVPMTNCHIWYGSLRESGGKGIALVNYADTSVSDYSYEAQTIKLNSFLVLTARELKNTQPFKTYLRQIPLAIDLRHKEAIPSSFGAWAQRIFNNRSSCPWSLTKLKMVPSFVTEVRATPGTQLLGFATVNLAVVDKNLLQPQATILHELVHAITGLRVTDEYIPVRRPTTRDGLAAIDHLLRSHNCVFNEELEQKWLSGGQSFVANHYSGCFHPQGLRSSNESLMRNWRISQLLNIPSCASVLSHLKDGSYRRHLPECSQFPDSEIIKE